MTGRTFLSLPAAAALVACLAACRSRDTWETTEPSAGESRAIASRSTESRFDDSSRDTFPGGSTSASRTDVRVRTTDSGFDRSSTTPPAPVRYDSSRALDPVPPADTSKSGTSLGTTGFSSIRTATAVLSPIEGHQTSGTLRFDETADELRVQGEISGLQPNKQYALVVHECGDVSSKDGSSVGGVFVPDGAGTSGNAVKDVGGTTLPGSTTERLGPSDLGLIRTDANGVARVDIRTRNLSLAQKNAILGRAVVLSEIGTDGTAVSVPGDLSLRRGCGVIGVAKTSGGTNLDDK